MTKKKAVRKRVRFVAAVRGRLTDAEIAQIDELVDSGREITASGVARRLNRCHGTIYWHMMNRGYLEHTISYANTEPYQRKGRWVYPWTQPEDKRLTDLRVEGLGYAEIAEVVVREFGRPRTGHSVYVRLSMLAAFEGTPESDAVLFGTAPGHQMERAA